LDKNWQIALHSDYVALGKLMVVLIVTSQSYKNQRLKTIWSNGEYLDLTFRLILIEKHLRKELLRNYEDFYQF